MAELNYLNVSGRLVQGDVFTAQDKDMKGRPMTDQKGNPKVHYFMAVAVHKAAPDLRAAMDGIQAVAMAGFPGGQQTARPDFAWKIVDGDRPENAGKEGFPGHLIFRFTSGFPFRPVTKNAERPIVDQAEIKRGYYVRVFFTVAANGDQQKPGVYLNGSIVELLGYGPEISAGPDASGIIKGAGQAVMPMGAMATPVSAPQYPQPGPPAAPQYPPAGPPQQYPPQGPQPGPQAGQIAPYPGILNPGGY